MFWVGLSLSGRQGVSAALRAAARGGQWLSYHLWSAVVAAADRRIQWDLRARVCDRVCVSVNRLVVGWRWNTNGDHVQSVDQDQVEQWIFVSYRFVDSVSDRLGWVRTGQDKSGQMAYGVVLGEAGLVAWSLVRTRFS